MRRTWHLITKESLLLARDWHALLLLFLMPAAFILVMSLALQGQFAARSGVHVGFYLLNRDSGPVNREMLAKLHALHGFRMLASAGADASDLEARVRGGAAQFLVIMPAGFGAALAAGQPKPLTLLATPDVSPAVYQLFQAQLREMLGRLYLQQLPAPVAAAAARVDANALLSTRILYGPGTAAKLPSSVQQNVPAWLLFAMFFIAIPLSTTWVQERQQGTYARLRSIGLGAPTLLAGKLVPYVALNVLQVVLMLLVGVYVVPWLGGGKLVLGHSPGGLALMAGVSSFAAVSYALLVANLVSTSEQATIFTGVANLLMAALGGIMVPRFIMPQAMQAISQYSPMAWGLDGFLDIFLRDGGIAMVWDEAAKLAAFGAACLLLTAGWMRWHRAG